jgi:hypothetical protein
MKTTVTTEQMLPIQFMQNIAIKFGEVPSEEVTDEKLLQKGPKDKA